MATYRKTNGWIRLYSCPPHLLASDSLKDAAAVFIDKLSVKNGSYPPDSYPNPCEYAPRVA